MILLGGLFLTNIQLFDKLNLFTAGKQAESVEGTPMFIIPVGRDGP